MKAEPGKEHAWLQKIVGEWVAEDESGPSWTETGRSLHGVWFVCEGRGPMPDGSEATTMLTLGYDPAKGKYVGTWFGSMMTYLWVYEGTLEGNVLTLDTVGPDFTGDGTRMARYQDIIEFVTDDHRTLTSRTQGDDGEWTQVMQTHYHRKG
jgi:hypothetical protein